MQICYDQISAVEVNEAFQLREAGHQRLRKKISTTSITVFVFSLYFPNSEDVITFVEVQPIQRADSRHVFFDVNVLYDTVNISRVIDNAFIDAVQCIYDVYIQASRWTFDHHDFRRRPRGKHSSVDLASVIGKCPTKPPFSMIMSSSESAFLKHAENVSNAGPPSSVVSTQPSDLKFVTTEAGEALTAAPGLRDKLSREPVEYAKFIYKRKMAKQPTLDDITTALAATIIDGSMQIAKKGQIPVKDLDQVAFSVLAQVRPNQDFDSLLWKGAAEFAKNRKLVQWEAKIKRKRMPEKRDREFDRQVRRVGVLHAIVNNLLLTDGISALSVVTALSARGNCLSTAGDQNEHDRQAIAESVAAKLGGKLQDPDGFIPNPILFTALLLKKNRKLRATDSHELNIFSEACHVLGLPCLAVLQFETSVWNSEISSVTTKFSDIRMGWSAFENASPELQRLRHLLHLVREFGSLNLLRATESAVTLLESGLYDQALAFLESSKQYRLSKDPQSEAGNPAVLLPMFSKAFSLLLPPLSLCVESWLKFKESCENFGSVRGDKLGIRGSMGDGPATTLCPDVTTIWDDGSRSTASVGFHDMLWSGGHDETQISDLDLLFNFD